MTDNTNNTPDDLKEQSPPLENSDRDPNAVIAVDWERVETETQTEYPTELRRIIERTGTTADIVLDKWGYSNYSTTALFTAIQKHSQIIIPDRGPLPKRYISLRGCDITISLRVAVHNADLNHENIVNGVDDNITFS